MKPVHRINIALSPTHWTGRAHMACSRPQDTITESERATRLRSYLIHRALRESQPPGCGRWERGASTMHPRSTDPAYLHGYTSGLTDARLGRKYTAIPVWLIPPGSYGRAYAKGYTDGHRTATNERRLP